jgi:hypothetical protein
MPHSQIYAHNIYVHSNEHVRLNEMRIVECIREVSLPNVEWGNGSRR